MHIEIETHKPDSSIDKRLVAVCNASMRGPGFGKQIAELEKRAGEIPVAIVALHGFPEVRGKRRADCQHAETARGKGRRGQYRMAAMLAFEAFRKQHEKRTDFAAWQQSAPAPG